MHRQTHSPVHENLSIHGRKSPDEHLGDPAFTLDDTPLTLGDLTPDNDEVPDINFNLSSIEASLSDQSEEECNHRSKRVRLYSPQLQAPESSYDDDDNEEEQLLLSAGYHLPDDRTRTCASAVPVQNESELSLQSAHLDNFLLETFVSVDDRNSSGMVQLRNAGRDTFPLPPPSDDESEDGALYNVSFSGSELERSRENVDAEEIVDVSNMDNIIRVTNPLHNMSQDARPSQQSSTAGRNLLDDSWSSISLYVSSHDNSNLSPSGVSAHPSTSSDQMVPSSSDDDLLQSIELQGRRRILCSCNEQVVPQIDHIEE